MEETSNICVRRGKSREEKRKLVRKVFKDRMAEIFWNWWNNKLKIQEYLGTRTTWIQGNKSQKKRHWKTVEKQKQSQNLKRRKRKKRKKNNSSFLERIMEAKGNIMNFKLLPKTNKQKTKQTNKEKKTLPS